MEVVEVESHVNVREFIDSSPFKSMCLPVVLSNYGINHISESHEKNIIYLKLLSSSGIELSVTLFRLLGLPWLLNKNKK